MNLSLSRIGPRHYALVVLAALVLALIIWRPALVFIGLLALGIAAFLLLGRGKVFLGPRAMPALGVLILAFALAFNWSSLLALAKVLCVILAVLALLDLIYLFAFVQDVSCQRDLSNLLSLGADNPIQITIRNKSGRNLSVHLVDELPEQLQRRAFGQDLKLEAGEARSLEYTVCPKVRGVYGFGQIHLLVHGLLGLFRRRLSYDTQTDVKVYPSLIEMREFELKAYSRAADQEGSKRVRRSGVSYEFDQIRAYVKGDDIRHMNWKASARGRDLMVNRYEVERSQPIYNVICKSREMCMPFNGLSLMDHAINTSLAVSNVAMLKHDRAGLLTFSDRIGSIIPAKRDSKQLKLIMNALYNEAERETESNYSLLDKSLKQVAPNRSLIFLYINFESMNALERALPHLKAISRRHLLVVIFFENVEIKEMAHQEVEDLRGIYTQSIAQRMIREKKAMHARLRQAGIQAILTPPEYLSMATVDSYLDMKSRGRI